MRGGRGVSGGGGVGGVYEEAWGGGGRNLGVGR